MKRSISIARTLLAVSFGTVTSLLALAEPSVSAIPSSHSRLTKSAVSKSVQTNTAQTNTAQTNTAQTNIAQTKPPKRLVPLLPRSQRPNQTRAGGSLNESCTNSEKALSAVVPKQNPVTTLRAQPTIWVYVPYAKEKIDQAEFVVNVGTDERQRLYRSAIALPPTPGFISLTLPTEIPLQVGTAYRWYFTIQCKGAVSRVQLTVEGGIERLASGAVAPENAWYDRVANTAKKMQLQNGEGRDRWRQILEEIGLADLINEPLLDDSGDDSGDVGEASIDDYRDSSLQRLVLGRVED